ncbi:MAG: pyruvate kinase [Acidobacteriota bacterium]
MRRTKIVATIGPASRSADVLRALIEAGTDVVRLNFAHGNAVEHARMIRRARRLARSLGRPLAILQDLQGPKIRIGRLRGGRAEIRRGSRLILTSRRVLGHARLLPTNYRRLPQEVRSGDRVLLDDGRIELRVISASGTEIRCRAVEGGTVLEHKGINLPGVRLSAPALTDKDRADALLGTRLGVDYVALSFVRRAQDLHSLRRLLEGEGLDTPIIAKIEKPEAVQNLDEILQASDGVMVARGDLGVEMSPEEVPIVQKHVVARGRAAGKPVITATQMLDSMRVNPRPTRAESSDVANATFDGADALMLSGETADGRYPVESVAMMQRIIQRVESAAILAAAEEPFEEGVEVAETLADAACRVAKASRARGIVALTVTGSTARLISSFRPPVPVIALSPEESTVRRLALFWGVRPLLSRRRHSIEHLLEDMERRLIRENLASLGDSVVIISGLPFTPGAPTNLLKVHRITHAPG